MMLRVLVPVTLCAIFASVGATADDAANAPAVSALRIAQPSVRWDERSVVVADITCDGKPDRIAVGYGKDNNVWVGLVHGGTRPVTMQFPVGREHSTSFCSTPVRLEASPLACSDEDVGALSGCKEVKGCSAFSAVDDSCDSFHFYWTASRNKLVWWRR